MALTVKQEKELVAKLEEMFQSALDHPSWQEWRTLIAPKCYRYREGDQWTAKERQVLKRRRQPETSITRSRLQRAKGSAKAKIL